MEEKEIKNSNVIDEALGIINEYFPEKEERLDSDIDHHDQNLELEFNIYEGGYQVIFTPGYETGYKVYGTSKDIITVSEDITSVEVINFINLLNKDLEMVRYIVDKDGKIDISYIVPSDKYDSKGYSFYCLEIKFSYAPKFFNVDLSWINKLLKEYYIDQISNTPEYKRIIKEEKEEFKNDELAMMCKSELIDISSKLTEEELRVALGTLSFDRLCEVSKGIKKDYYQRSLNNKE